jgi:hypothetical protein
MYLTSGQPNIMGPGTGLVQRYNWTPDQEKQLRTAFGKGMGCGCSGLGCKCGGMGLFDSGMDPSGWGWPEMVIVGLGGYMVLSTLMTTKRAARSIHGTVSGAYRGAKSGGRDANSGGKRKRYNPGRRKARR